MKLRKYVIVIVLLLSISISLFCQAKENDLLEELSHVSGQTYTCKSMVHVVNVLRREGKAKALVLLDKHAQLGSCSEQIKVLAICRLLFVNTNRWEYEHLGQVVPSLNSDVIGKFPLFPIALSDGVPFLLISGYNGGGLLPRVAINNVKTCRDLEMIKADLPETGFLEAAEHLVNTDLFHRLYKNENDAKEMAISLEFQARGLPRERKRSPE